MVLTAYGHGSLHATLGAIWVESDQAKWKVVVPYDDLTPLRATSSRSRRTAHDFTAAATSRDVERRRETSREVRSDTDPMRSVKREGGCAAGLGPATGDGGTSFRLLGTSARPRSSHGMMSSASARSCANFPGHLLSERDARRGWLSNPGTRRYVVSAGIAFLGGATL